MNIEVSMQNREPVVVTEEWQVKQELRVLGLTPEIIRNIAIAAAGARADALPVDPCSAPGTLAYIQGVRSIRLQLLPQGWEISRVGNVESTVNFKRGVQLCFQNVDVACTAKNPEAISGKGAASRSLVLSGQTELFPRQEEAPEQELGTTPVVWLICVSSDDETVRAEVSCPEAFEGNQFEGFKKRLFVIDESFEPSPDQSRNSDDDFPDIDVQVTKK